MRFLCTRAVAVFVSGLAFTLVSHSALAGEGWRIVDTAGEVTAGGTGFMPIALSNNQTLPGDAWIETKATGRAVLARGFESIVVGPNSRVQLPDDETNGNTQVLQTMGSALYRIGKQQKPHFQVDTPYLAAVVKGTSFTVTVGDNDATVAVSEGLVEVSTRDHTDVEFVMPGFKSRVSHDHNGEVVVEKSGDAPAQSAEPEQSSENNSTSDKDTDEEGKLARGEANDGTVVIVATIGEVVLDIKEVSGGLAHDEVIQTTTESPTTRDFSTSTEETKDGAVVQTDSVQIAGGQEAIDPIGAPMVELTAPDLGTGDMGSVVTVGGDTGTAPDLGPVDATPVLDDANGGNALGHLKDKTKNVK